MTETEIKKGLAGVVVDTTAISKVNPETNSLLYRGYPVQDLAAQLPFEAVALLLWTGELPTDEELAAFEHFERAHRALDPKVKQAIDLLPTDCHPMDVGRTAVSVLGANHPKAEDSSPEAELEKAQALFAAFPAVVAYDQRRRRGQDVVEPREDLDYSQNFLWMTFGEEAAPEVVDAFRVSMVLYAEHSFNASTFTARVITSTLSDLHSAVTGAIGALKGPLHGGANEAVLNMLRRIKSEGITPEDFMEKVKNKEDGVRLMGFGHRVYKNYDPRAKIIKKTAEDILGKMGGNDELLEIAQRLEEKALADDYFVERKLYPNVDFYTGVIYKAMGFPEKMFTVLFALGRLPGWIAQWRELMEDPATKIGRPRQIYVGEQLRQYPQR